jgi:hypothetical protein
LVETGEDMNGKGNAIWRGYLIDVLQLQGGIAYFEIAEGYLTNFEIARDIWHFTR